VGQSPPPPPGPPECSAPANKAGEALLAKAQHLVPARPAAGKEYHSLRRHGLNSSGRHPCRWQRPCCLTARGGGIPPPSGPAALTHAASGCRGIAAPTAFGCTCSGETPGATREPTDPAHRPSRGLPLPSRAVLGEGKPNQPKLSYPPSPFHTQPYRVCPSDRASPAHQRG